MKFCIRGDKAVIYKNKICPLKFLLFFRIQIWIWNWFRNVQYGILQALKTLKNLKLPDGSPLVGDQGVSSTPWTPALIDATFRSIILLHDGNEEVETQFLEQKRP